MTPTSFGHYRVDGRIGSGGMGEVYRGFDTRLNRPVALKLLRTGDTDQSDIVQRFLREARAASALNHPNIVTIHEVGEDAGTTFIAMELVDGVDVLGFDDQEQSVLGVRAVAPDQADPGHGVVVQRVGPALIARA